MAGALGPHGFPQPGRGYIFMRMLYRGKKDGAVLLGLRHPWEHHGHGHHENGHASSNHG
ncbi:830_t:CDS:2 [Scutellospora calospora]|uniref:830_t:CDS:1 n=1 Tax=Scutellospora calospora TaxID=85575 RepID=A0ACA9MTQ1_9GLOM|nr:830_t:CDS:2 [Scutellospora calospora]